MPRRWASGPLATWEEHKVVLERRRTARWPTRRTRPRQGSPRTRLRPWLRRRRRSGSSRRLPRRPRPGLLARPPRTAPWRPVPARAKGGGKGAASKICFHFRDHGNCPKGDSCPFSHDKELRKQALAAKRGESTLAAKGGKGGGKGGGKAGAAPKAKPKAKPKAAAKAAPKPPGTVCPFFHAEDGLVQEGSEL